MYCIFSYKLIEYKIESVNFGDILREVEKRLGGGAFESEENFPLLKAIDHIQKIRAFSNRFQQLGADTCRAIIGNNALVKRLREERFNAVLLSDFFVSRCLHLIPQRILQVPYASFGESESPWDMRLPALPQHFIGQEVSGPLSKTDSRAFSNLFFGMYLM